MSQGSNISTGCWQALWGPVPLPNQTSMFPGSVTQGQDLESLGFLHAPPELPCHPPSPGCSPVLHSGVSLASQDPWQFVSSQMTLGGGSLPMSRQACPLLSAESSLGPHSLLARPSSPSLRCCSRSFVRYMQQSKKAVTQALLWEMNSALFWQLYRMGLSRIPCSQHFRRCLSLY